MATAQVLLHRFYYMSSMLSFGVKDIAISSLYLSSKLNETPIRLLSLRSDYDLSGAMRRQGQDGWRVGMGKGGIWDDFKFKIPGFHDDVRLGKDVIVASEMQILKRLGFHMQVDLPYSHVINYCKILDLVFEEDFAQSCWSILNDALLTPLYAIHPPHTLACASIFLSARLRRIPLPQDWHVLFDVTQEDMTLCAGTIMRLWYDWGIGPVGSVVDEKAWEEGSKEREARWRRAWILCEGRRVVRKWVEERADPVRLAKEQ